MMPELCLAIEISNPSASPAGAGPGVALGLIEGGSVRQVLGIEPLAASRRHDDDLVPAMDRLLGRAGVPPDRLARVGVSVGPGGFTSLRMAVAAAKMICEATGAACVAVPSAQVVARRVAAAVPFAVALASKEETAFAACFEPGGRPAGPARLIDAAALGGLGVGVLVADRYLPPPIRARAAELGIQVIEPVFDPAACLECAAAGTPIDPLVLAPIYPRLPEAVLKWRELHPAP